jgi:hypothetical protein
MAYALRRWKHLSSSPDHPTMISTRALHRFASRLLQRQASAPRVLSAADSDAGSVALQKTEKALRWLIIAALALPIGVVLVDGILSYFQTWQDSGTQLSRLARIAQEHALKVFEVNRSIEGRITDLLANRDDAAIAADEAATHEGLVHIAQDIPQIAAIAVFGWDGTLLASSFLFPVPPVDISQREDFLALAQKPSLGPLITSVRRAKMREIEIFNVDEPRLGSDGSFAGMVGIALSPQYFAQFYSELAEGMPNSSVTLLHADGEVLAGYPASPNPAERMTDKGPLARAPTVGVLSTRSASDRQERLVAYGKVGSYP